MNTNNKEKFRKLVLSPLLKVGLLRDVPLLAITGAKIKALDDQHSKVSIKYSHINKNPYKTTFWAVLGMAAEMASALLVQMNTYKSNPSIAMFVTACDAKFIKRAIGTTTFICNDGELISNFIQKALETNESQTMMSNVKGFDDNGVLLVEFNFEWSFKARSKK
jgi:hypothetical protein